MPATAIPTPALAPAASAPMRPLIPAVVVGSFKGGCWKTSIAVALAERLAHAGLSVLLLTCDRQEDARTRLGVSPSASVVAVVQRGPGRVSVAGIRGSKAVDLLYRSDPAALKDYDVAVMDTPPAEESGRLPGVLLIAPLDGTDAAKNLVVMLRSTPGNSDIALVRVGRMEPLEWAKDATAIGEAADRKVRFLSQPLPRSTPVAEAHNEGRSVWSLPRRGCTMEFLTGIEALAGVAWGRLGRSGAIPPMPPPAASVFVPGWDDEDGA